MDNVGIKGTAHDLIQLYLSNRKQQVMLLYKLSQTNCGAPQGTVLRPLLFII